MQVGEEWLIDMFDQLVTNINLLEHEKQLIKLAVTLACPISQVSILTVCNKYNNLFNNLI